MKNSWEKQQDGVIFKNVRNLEHPNPGVQCLVPGSLSLVLEALGLNKIRVT